jgi:Tfp pilus assembly protein PilN
VGTQALSQAIEHAASQCRAIKDSLLVVADADHRASRTAELFESLQDVVPGLDPMLAVTRLGEACGELGMARALAPSALACTALRSTGEPGQVAVAAHVQSSHDRVVVALAPWVPAAAAA